LKIALDFDSVLSDTMTLWVAKYNEKYNKKHTKANVTKWEFWDDFGISLEEAKSIFRITWEDWENLCPTEKDLSKTTYQLNNIAQVDIVTSVEKTHENYVKKWLEKHNITYKDIVITNHDKHEHDYDIFIDDDPKLPGKVKSRCFVYHQEWNRDVVGGNVERINELKHVLDKLNKKDL